MKNQKNLKLATCIKIFWRHDRDMWELCMRHKEFELNMDEVSNLARLYRDKKNLKKSLDK